MSSLFKSKSKTSTSQTYDPRVYGESLQNLQLAEQVAAMPFQQYRGPMVAPFTRDYMMGERMTRGIASQGGYVPEIEQAARASQAALGFQPAAVQGAKFTDTSLGEYMNPYQQGVIDVGLQDINRQDELARQQRAQRATAARAFGGSRAAIQEGIAAGEAARERNRFLAEQRSQGFQQAAQLREADVRRQQQAALANQQAGLQGAQFRLGAAQQLGGLGQQALQNRYGAAQAMMGMGQAQQQLAQQMMGAQQQEFMRRQQYPLQQLAVRQGALASALVNQQGLTRGTQTPSLMKMIGQAASIAEPFIDSDERMKKNIETIKNPLDKVNRLKGVEFEWKDDDSEDSSVIAQDVEKVMPSAVRKSNNGMRQVNAAQMIGLLTEAVKELDAKVSKRMKA
jgi:hypothetical protein